MPKRLFIALELPVGCREALAALAEPIPGVRWVAADQLHVTLAFLEASQSREFGTVAVEGFTLFSSVLRPAGAAYGVEERHSLVTR